MGKINDLKFGDIVRNNFASKSNPHKIGIFVKYSPSADRIHLTDGSGDFWELVNDNSSDTVKVSSTHVQLEAMVSAARTGVI